MDAVSERTLKYSTNAVVGGLMFNYLTNDKGGNMLVTLPFMANAASLPTWAVGMMSGAAASMAADMAHNVLLPHIPVAKAMENQASALLTPVVAGAAFPAVQWLLNRGVFEAGGVDPLKMLAAGAVSELVAQYAYRNLVSRDETKRDEW